jgi:eukaryotic-like serine/threonine-protein kinase
MVAVDPRAEERVGSVLHEKWTLERLLGVGGMGAVYAARHRNGARAAVKVLSPSMGRVPHVRKRFLHEGYAANRVDHAGAVKVLDDDVIQDGTEEGTAYLVMELLDGESLGDRAKREPPLGERDLLEIADGVLAVLDAAHANGVVHRDLKPDNLFLARDPERQGTQIKVLDFGLARLLEAQEQTIAGMALGTPTYMSPEQAGGRVDQIDGRTDIYALGSILFQLLTNKRIHDAAHTLGLVVRMATTPAPKLRSIAPDVSEPFARIVDRALAFAREDRYPTAAAMRADVQSALAMSTEVSTLNVIASVQAPPVALALTSPGVDNGGWRKAAASADTIRVPAVAAKAAAPSLEPIARSERAPVVRGRDEDESERVASRRSPVPGGESRSPLRTAFVFAVLGFVGFGAWKNRPALERWLGPNGVAQLSSASTEPSASPEPAVSAVPSASVAESVSAAASASASASDVTLADASSAPISDAGDLVGSEDASLLAVVSLLGPDEPTDAGSDAGDDDEDDEDDEDVDAAAPTPPPPPAPVVSSWSSPVRRAPSATPTPHPSAKPPPPKKRPPRRPGQPRRKKRWHQ